MPKPRETVQLPEAVQEIIDRIVEGYDPEKIIIFGSYARGDASADSDLDLMVVKETSARWIDRHVEVSGLCTPRLIPMDIVVKTPAEIEDALAHRELFMREVMREGIVAYDRASG